MKTRMIIIAGLDNKTNSLWPLRDKTLTEIPYDVLDFLFAVWSEKVLAGTPCGYWHHSYITLLGGTDTTRLEAEKRQVFLFGWKKYFKTHSVYQHFLCPSVSQNKFLPFIPSIICHSLYLMAHFHPSSFDFLVSAVSSHLPRGEGTISSLWVDNPLWAHLQGIMWATLLTIHCVVSAWSA